MNTQLPLKIKLSSDDGMQLKLIADDASKRSFAGIANSGKPFGHGNWWSIVDLENLDFKETIPVLYEHDVKRPIGVAKLNVVDGQLHTTGVLFVNDENGKKIAQLADDGFLWEMSVYVEASRYEELTIGSSAVVNGNTVNGPLSIMRGCKIREVSFVALGADANTGAAVLSETNQSTHKELEMTDEEKNKLAELEKKIADLEKENTELKAAKKKENINVKLAVAGFKLGADGNFEGISPVTMKVLLAADDADTDALIKDLTVKLGTNVDTKPPIPTELLTGLPIKETEANQTGENIKVSLAQGSGGEYV